MSQVTQAFPDLDLETVKQKVKLATSPNRETKMAGYIQCDRRPTALVKFPRFLGKEVWSSPNDHREFIESGGKLNSLEWVERDSSRAQ
ncbi:MAG: hypothetical protein HWQ38_30735 [Nostoc sp. NMS7]|uniref:hypothetical protein n=1 Tax=Nostoc sp. NMS7 TaxID=2815391 RepID=UPI0025F38CE0|nr:hypothetical protein [Nostoc sp. NMS7]MBN3950607.1 hypothetical protein [Nostoc sp. NMS7]